MNIYNNNFSGKHIDRAEKSEQKDFSYIINNNILDYESHIDEIEDSLDSIKYEQKLDDDTIKKNYQKYFFPFLNGEDEQNTSHKSFVLYSGEEFSHAKDIILGNDFSLASQKHVFLFLQSFIEYSKKNSGENQQRSMTNFYIEFLNVSPNLFNCINFEQLFLILSQLIKDDIFAVMRDNLINECHYIFTSLNQASIDIILTEIDKGGSESALQTLNMLAFIIRRKVGYEQDQFFINVEKISQYISQKYNSPFFQYKTKNLLQKEKGPHPFGYLTSSSELLQKINNASFEGYENQVTLKMAADYVSPISNLGYSNAIAEYQEINEDYEQSIKNHVSNISTSLENARIISKEIRHLRFFHDRTIPLIYQYLTNYYFNDLQSDKQKFEDVCKNLIGNPSGKKLYDTLIGSIETREHYNPHSDTGDGLMTHLSSIYRELSPIFMTGEISHKESKKTSLIPISYKEILSKHH
ncbi:MAG: hypothetical protein GY828_02450, partial [Candidatus Gracilibacteria bacterium]|nr:hypothetical protein [Candidatus Gracilibacteria bacterium]